MIQLFLVLIAIFGINTALIKLTNNFQDKFVVYQIYCSDLEHSTYDCPTKIITSTISYRIFLKKQMVIAKGALLTRYDDCVVYDRENWRCTNDKGYVIALTDGRYYNSAATQVTEGKFAPSKTDSPASFPIDQQVSGFESWWRKRF